LHAFSFSHTHPNLRRAETLLALWTAEWSRETDVARERDRERELRLLERERKREREREREKERERERERHSQPRGAYDY
jgi:hypothetical protein